MSGKRQPIENALDLPHDPAEKSRPHARFLTPAFVALAALIALHATLLAWSAFSNSVAYDEFAHLPAGVAYWKHGELSIYNQSPPLLRWLGAWPAVVAGAVAPDPAAAMAQPLDVRYWAYGGEFLAANPERYHTYFVLGRLAMIPLSCAGVWIAYRFARELYDSEPAGIGAAAMVALCPNLAAHASLVGTDAGTAVFMLAAVWFWWRFCNRPTFSRALLAAALVAFSHLCKFYAVLLWPMLGVIAAARGWAIWRQSSTHNDERAPSRLRCAIRPVGGLAMAGLITLLVINLAYRGHGSLRSIGSYTFEGTTLRAIARLLPSATPIPLPNNFVEGYDAAQAEVQTQFPGYLLGNAYRGSRWNYYPVALACKLPLSILLLLTLAAGTAALSTVRRLRAPIAARRLANPASLGVGEFVILLALVIFIAGFLFAARINIGVRYLLPAFPLAFVLASRLWTMRFLRPVAWCLLATLLIENLAAAPHYLSFYNAAVGRGYPIVNDFDWGQSLIELRDWMKANDIPRIALAYNGRVDPRLYGIDYVPLIEDVKSPYVALSGYYMTGNGRPMVTPHGMSTFIAIPFSQELMRIPPLTTLGSILVYARTDLEAAQREWQANARNENR